MESSKVFFFFSWLMLMLMAFLDEKNDLSFFTWDPWMDLLIFFLTPWGEKNTFMSHCK